MHRELSAKLLARRGIRLHQLDTKKSETSRNPQLPPPHLATPMALAAPAPGRRREPEFLRRQVRAGRELGGVRTPALACRCRQETRDHKSRGLPPGLKSGGVLRRLGGLRLGVGMLVSLAGVRCLTGDMPRLSSAQNLIDAA